MERIGRDMDDLREKMETFIKNNGRLNEQNTKTEAEEAAVEKKDRKSGKKSRNLLFDVLALL